MSTFAVFGISTDAMALAGSDALMHSGLTWKTDGGRQCPIGWGDCSQPVFHNMRHDIYDYGESSGPGAAYCENNCPHHNQIPELEEA